MAFFLKPRPLGYNHQRQRKKIQPLRLHKPPVRRHPHQPKMTEKKNMISSVSSFLQRLHFGLELYKVYKDKNNEK